MRGLEELAFDVEKLLGPGDHMQHGLEAVVLCLSGHLAAASGLGLVAQQLLAGAAQPPAPSQITDCP